MQTDPDNTYIISTTDSSIAYTQTFIDDYKNGKYPIVEFDGDYHYIPYKNQIENNPFLKYIELNTQYLLKHPKSRIYQIPDGIIYGYNRILAESYTDRDPNQTYPNDKLIASQYNKNKNITTTVYIHTPTIENHVIWFYLRDTFISNPKANKYINLIYGTDYIFEKTIPPTIPIINSKFTASFLQSQHVKEKTIAYKKALYYTQKPDLETIIDYILTLQPEPDFYSYFENTDIVLNLDGHGMFSNNEIIAYTKPIDPNQPVVPIELTPTEIIKNKNWMKNGMLIKKIQRTDKTKTIGLFINAETINTLEPEIQSRTFGWICTKPHTIPIESSIWFNTIWGPTYTFQTDPS